MANPNPSEATRFKPGNCANPKGAGAHDPEKKAIKKLTTEQLSEVANLVLQGDIEQLRAVSQDPKASVLQAWIASIAARSISQGDFHTLDALVTRLIGKPKELAADTEPSGPRTQITVTIPSNGREAPGTATFVQLEKQRSQDQEVSH